jgi:hypothetical protein
MINGLHSGGTSQTKNLNFASRVTICINFALKCRVIPEKWTNQIKTQPTKHHMTCQRTPKMSACHWKVHVHFIYGNTVSAVVFHTQPYLCFYADSRPKQHGPPVPQGFPLLNNDTAISHFMYAPTSTTYAPNHFQIRTKDSNYCAAILDWMAIYIE